MRLFTIHNRNGAVHQVHGDDVTIAQSQLRVHKDGHIVYSDAVDGITSLDSIELKEGA